ncbi:MAG: DUF6011 domain-containing protein [Candidatus Thorarchaeota archaeon]
MVFLCKRCGRVLKSIKSIKLGYGPTCYRIIKFHDNRVNIHEEIKFLKIEINTLKKTLRELRINTMTSYQSPPIERMKIQEKTPERNIDRSKMTEVIQELKNRFQNCNGDVKSLLKPIQIDINLSAKSQLAIA